MGKHTGGKRQIAKMGKCSALLWRSEDDLLLQGGFPGLEMFGGLTLGGQHGVL